MKAQKKSERQQTMFKKLRQTLKPVQSGSILRVNLPKVLADENPNPGNVNPGVNTAVTNDSPNLKALLDSTIRVKQKDSEE